jgi:hypothetical protein
MPREQKCGSRKAKKGGPTGFASVSFDAVPEVDHLDMSSKVEVPESRVLHATDEEAAVGSHESGAAYCNHCRDEVEGVRIVGVRRPRRAHVGGR